jgi:hypothetical protein
MSCIVKFIYLRSLKSPDTSWVSSIPKAPANLDAFQWYEDGHRLLGISPDDRIELYRNHAN